MKWAVTVFREWRSSRSAHLSVVVEQQCPGDLLESVDELN